MMKNLKTLGVFGGFKNIFKFYQMRLFFKHYEFGFMH